jgi:alkyl hydroperoxide reductase subunit AhpF
VSVLGERDQSAIAVVFATLERDVALRLDVGPVATPVALLVAGGRELDPCAETRTLVEAVAAVSERVRLDVVEHERPGAYPSLTIGPGLVYLGLPWGHELATVVHGIAAAGRSEPGLSEKSLTQLAALDRDVALDVFVTPT